MAQHLNLYSGVQNFMAFPLSATEYADLSLGYMYVIIIANPTATDIDTGDIILEGADALPDNPCEPDT